MTETFTENVVIDGTQDVEQLRIQGHTTQTQSLQTWEDNAGSVLAQVTSDGRMQIGDDVGLSSPDAMLEAHRAETSISKPKRGFHALGRVGDALNNISQWIVQELEIRGSSSISALQTALRVRAANLNTGTPSAGAELRAADIEVINDDAAGNSPLPKATGLQIGVTNAAGKVISQAVGLHVKMDNEGTITTPYAIFTEGGGAVHFDDYVEVKRPSTSPGTPSTDLIRLYPKSDGYLYVKNWNGIEHNLSNTDVRQVVMFIGGWLSVLNDPARVGNDTGITRVITGVKLRVATAPTGAPLIVDIHKSGATIFTNQANRPQIASGAYQGSTANINVADWADDEYLEVQIDQVGSGIPGVDLTVSIMFS